MLETVVIYCKIFNLIKASWQEVVINYKNFGYIHLFLSFTWFVDRVWYFCWPLRRWFYPIIIKVCKKKKNDKIIHYLNCYSILYIKILNNKTKIIINFKINMLYTTVIKDCISFHSLFFKDDQEISSLNGENDKTWSVFQFGNFEKWRQKEKTFLEIAWRASLVCRIQCIPRATLLLKKFWAKRWDSSCRRFLLMLFNRRWNPHGWVAFWKKPPLMFDCFVAQILQFFFYYFVSKLKYSQ